MRLLNTETHQLHQFLSGGIPPYAILSHCWGAEEVSFGALRDCRMVDDEASEAAIEEKSFPYLRELRQHRVARLKSRQGWQKIERLCEQARAYNLQWAWIDTACIDKSSSAELQEAINSMFKWYQNSENCFVYMHDVREQDDLNTRKAQFLASKWFKRGWTLQELIAPCFPTRIFLDRNWEHIGSDMELVDAISQQTRIPHEILSEINTVDKIFLLWGYSVAQRMSWAADRQVSREEDVAYSLLGLFEVNMPLLYGEGSTKAFERLQLEILKNSTDESILAWRHELKGGGLRPRLGSVGPLSPSPQCFKDATKLEHLPSRGSLMKKGFQMTPRGLLVRAPLIGRREGSAVARALLETGGWDAIADFAFPLLVKCSDEQSGKREHIVFFQVMNDGRQGYDYTRRGDPFLAEVDLDELAKQKAPEEFCLRSAQSVSRQL